PSIHRLPCQVWVHPHLAFQRWSNPWSSPASWPGGDRGRDEVPVRQVEIDALLRAHRGRARPVAFFHVLRQPALQPDDHAFLTDHIAELGATDLLRWRARCEPGHTGVVIRRLAELAIEDPASFEHEV